MTLQNQIEHFLVFRRDIDQPTESSYLVELHGFPFLYGPN